MKLEKKRFALGQKDGIPLMRRGFASIISSSMKRIGEIIIPFIMMIGALGSLPFFVSAEELKTDKWANIKDLSKVDVLRLNVWDLKKMAAELLQRYNRLIVENALLKQELADLENKLAKQQPKKVPRPPLEAKKKIAKKVVLPVKEKAGKQDLKRIRFLQKKRKALITELNRLQEKLQRSEKVIVPLREQVAILRQKHADLEKKDKKLQKAESEVTSAKEKALKAMKEVLMKDKTISNILEKGFFENLSRPEVRLGKIKELKKGNKEFSQEVVSYQQKVQQKEKFWQEMEQRIARQKKQDEDILMPLRQKKENLKKENAVLEKKLHTLEKEIGSLKTTQALRDDSKILQDRVKALEDGNKALRAKVHDLKDVLATLKKEKAMILDLLNLKNN